MENKVTGLNFECHVTLVNDEKLHAIWKKTANKFGWKTSFIVGDPVMPDQSGYLYFTKHSNSYRQLDNDMHWLCFGAELDGHIVRKKIELVLYDER